MAWYELDREVLFGGHGPLPQPLPWGVEHWLDLSQHSPSEQPCAGPVCMAISIGPVFLQRVKIIYILQQPEVVSNLGTVETGAHFEMESVVLQPIKKRKEERSNHYLLRISF